MGNILAVQIHAANIHDTKGGLYVFAKALRKYPSMQIKPIFEVLPKRWRVERIFSWMNHSRRLSKDYEIKLSSERAMLIISHFHTLLKRL